VRIVKIWLWLDFYNLQNDFRYAEYISSHLKASYIYIKS